MGWFIFLLLCTFFIFLCWIVLIISWTLLLNRTTNDYCRTRCVYLLYSTQSTVPLWFFSSQYSPDHHPSVVVLAPSLTIIPFVWNQSFSFSILYSICSLFHLYSLFKGNKKIFINEHITHFTLRSCTARESDGIWKKKLWDIATNSLDPILCTIVFLRIPFL